MMVGRELTQLFPKDNVPTDRVLLSVKGLSLDGTFSDVSFDVRAGEILGIAGLVGSKRTELAETIFGVRRATSGEILIDGVPGRHRFARGGDRSRDGVSHGGSKDRAGCSCRSACTRTWRWRCSAASSSRSGFVRQAKLLAACRATAAAVRVKTPDLFEPVQHLSGGNQQKVLVGRWLLTAPRILILDEPTRGIDVGAKAEIHRLISTLAAEGAAVIMISSEMPEILGMSDRVMVMRQGRVAGIVDRSEANQVDLMRLAAH